MAIQTGLILGLWLLFLVYWGFMALGAKRTIGGSIWRREGALRLAILVLLALALRVPAARRALRNADGHALGAGIAIGIAGVALCAFGIGLAIWARFHIGRNWGMPMSRKEAPELVTSGPYAVIRHPIYTGILLAMLGSALGQSVFWMLPLVLFGGYFIHSARREEKLMLQQFPDHYPAYMARTRMLVPFLF